MLHFLLVAPIYIAVYVAGAYATFRTWTAIHPPEEKYGEHRIIGFGKYELISSRPNWTLYEAALFCLAFWWVGLPVALPVFSASFLAKKFVSSMIKPPKPEVDSYEKIGMQEANKIAPGEI